MSLPQLQHCLIKPYPPFSNLQMSGTLPCCSKRKPCLPPETSGINPTFLSQHLSALCTSPRLLYHEITNFLQPRCAARPVFNRSQHPAQGIATTGLRVSWRVVQYTVKGTLEDEITLSNFSNQTKTPKCHDRHMNEKYRIT